MRWFVLLFGLFTLQSAWANDVIDVTVNVDIKKINNPTKTEIFREATDEISRRYIREIIGESKMDANTRTIRTKILKNSGKYILFIRGGDATGVDGSSAAVDIKISLKNLRSLLLAEGLLYELEGPPKILPMIAYQDKVTGRSLAWWLGGDNVGDSLSDLQSSLKTAFREKGFFLLSSADKGLKNMVPDPLRIESPRAEDYLLLGDFFGSAIVLRGHVKVSPHMRFSEVFQLEVRLEALQASNGRSIGEVVRTYETDRGAVSQMVSKKLKEESDVLANDLAVQLSEAWKRGTFGATLLRLKISGDLNFPQLNQFKTVLMNQVREIKVMRERLFAPGSVTFEVDSSTNASQLATLLKGQKFPRFKVEVGRVTSDELALSVNPW